jgi:hypothetical protein
LYSGCFNRIETGTFGTRWRKRQGEKGSAPAPCPNGLSGTSIGRGVLGTYCVQTQVATDAAALAADGLTSSTKMRNNARHRLQPPNLSLGRWSAAGAHNEFVVEESVRLWFAGICD